MNGMVLSEDAWFMFDAGLCRGVSKIQVSYLHLARLQPLMALGGISVILSFEWIKAEDRKAQREVCTCMRVCISGGVTQQWPCDPS